MKKVCPIVTPRPSTPFLQQKKESARLPLPSKSRLVYELHCCRASLLPFLPPMQMKLSTSSSPPGGARKTFESTRKFLSAGNRRRREEEEEQCLRGFGHGGRKEEGSRADQQLGKQNNPPIPRKTTIMAYLIRCQGVPPFKGKENMMPLSTYQRRHD